MTSIEEAYELAAYYKTRALDAEAELSLATERNAMARERGAFDFFQAAMSSEFVDNESQLQIADAYFHFSGTRPEQIRQRINERSKVPMSAGQLSKVVHINDFR